MLSRPAAGAKPTHKPDYLLNSIHSSGTAPEESLITTLHSIIINGTTIRYNATVGRLPVVDSKGTTEAFIFFTSYERQPATNIEQRPVTFAFNGGPGGSSIWLHLGAAGPLRVPLKSQGTTLPSTNTLINNAYTWLTFTDLVFIDPVGTGYSRPALKVQPDKFYTVDGDITAAANFILTFLSRFKRWKSPLYIAGESYGTTRAVGLSDYLQSEKAIAPSGIILLSSALNFQTFLFDPGNDLPCVLILPTFTASAWYHHRLDKVAGSRELTDILTGAESWSQHEYLMSLFKGLRLTPEEKSLIEDSLAKYSGLSRAFITEHGIRISQLTFAQKLLEDSSIGILDSRITALNISNDNPFSYSDPSLFITSAPYTALINDYLRRDLGYRTPLEYVYLSEAINRQWKWTTPSSQGYLNMTPLLAKAMSINPRLRVFAGMGYYDLATPYFSQRYAFEHLGSDSSLFKRCTIRSYATGHQIYTSDTGLESLTKDLNDFFVSKQ
jgi:carboxypeptidase C (cathepsin A)